MERKYVGIVYLDILSKEYIKEKDIIAPSGRYIECREGVQEGIIIERYIVSFVPLKKIDFAYSVRMSEEKPLLDERRKEFFKENNIEIAMLCAVTVPPSVYKEILLKAEKRG